MFAKQDFFYPNTHDCYEDIPWTLMMPFDEPRVVRGDYLNPNIAETSRTLLEIRFTRLENLMFTAVICPPDQNVESREFRDEGLLPVDDIVILPDDEMLFVVLHNVGSMLVAMQVSPTRDVMRSLFLQLLKSCSSPRARAPQARLSISRNGCLVF